MLNHYSRRIVINAVALKQHINVTQRGKLSPRMPSNLAPPCASVYLSALPGAASVEAFGNDTLFSVEEQDSLTNASQITTNQGVIQALQQLGGVGNGTNSTLQASNTQVNVQATQEQENVEGTLVNVGEGHQGVVIINTNDETGAVGECLEGLAMFR